MPGDDTTCLEWGIPDEGWVATLLVLLAWGVTWGNCPRLVPLGSRVGVTILGLCPGGVDPSGPTDMGSEGDLVGVPPFPSLIYSPVPACHLASGASMGWEG